MRKAVNIICGILAEVVPGHPHAVVVGAGVNTAMTADQLPVATATSFAAFMAHGSVPPRSPAARASARQRNVPVSGAANSSEPSFVKSSGSTGASQRSG